MWPGVAGNLAKFEDKLRRTRMTEAKLKEKQSLYSRPKNCEVMVPPELQQPHTRSQDIRMQKVKNSFLKGLMPLTQLTNTPSSCKTVYHVRAENPLLNKDWML